MPSPYGSVAVVKELLQATGDDTWDAAATNRMTNLLTVVSDRIEFETGKRFGVDPLTTQTFVAESYQPHRLLFLPLGLRSLASVTESASWDGAAWSGGTVLAGTEYRLPGLPTNGVYGAILGVGRWWSGSFLVTGTWENEETTVPAGIDYLANYITAEVWKKQSASPAGFTGPDGAVVPIRDVFKETEVVTILNDYRLHARALVL
jgi:hypothetical protein